jgi:5'(3')-deoxyribonucleotidase
MTLICCDLDDTIFDLMTPWLNLYYIPSKHRLYKEDITEWDLQKFVKPEFKEVIYKIGADPKIYNKVKPISGALESYNYLKNKKNKQGDNLYDIVFATHSFIGCEGRKYQCLLDNGFDVDQKNYIEIYRKNLLNVDFIVDDRIDNVRDTPGVGILFTAPWNKNIDWFPRANNWEDVINIIEGREEWKN